MAIALLPAGGEPQAERPADWPAVLKPGKYHRHLDHLIGTWKLAGKSWPVEGAETIHFNGTQTCRWVAAGTFVEAVMRGSYDGLPLIHHAYTGYDNAAKEYTKAAFDNWGTHIMHKRGNGTEDGKTRIFLYTYVVPQNLMKIRVKEVLKVIDENSYTEAAYQIKPDGTEFLSMHIVYTRVE